MSKIETKKNKLSARMILLLWTLGMAGQICWNVENQWFNTFVYEHIAPNSSIVSWMVGVSAAVTAISTFLAGTWSDRHGIRKPVICLGYILWGVFTIAFGLTQYASKFVSSLMVIAVMVVLADGIMSFFGSMGNDSGFNAWISDNLNHDNQGAIGATVAVQPVLGTIIGTVLGGMIIAMFDYMVFFLVMGLLVIAIGVLALFILKEDKDPNRIKKEGSFIKQFFSNFNFKEFFKLKELVWVNILTSVFFIAFNIYFVYIGNIFIYTYGFGADEAGYIQGFGLIIAIVSTLPASSLINKDKSPLALLLAFIINIIGLLVLYFTIDLTVPSKLLSLSNLPLFIGVILVGIGYIVTLQTITVWGKSLYPENSRGQFEGIRIIFFVLLPMIIGPLIANPIINTYGKEITLTYATGSIAGMAPTKLLFLVASFASCFAFIPLYFANKHYKKRISK